MIIVNAREFHRFLNLLNFGTKMRPLINQKSSLLQLQINVPLFDSECLEY